MSSRLPVAVTRTVLAAAETEPGSKRYQCAGYVTRTGFGRRRHGAFLRAQVAIDHVVPEADGGAVADPANLQVLCSGKDSCHTRKTADEATKRARGTTSHGARVLVAALLCCAYAVIMSGVAILRGDQALADRVGDQVWWLIGALALYGAWPLLRRWHEAGNRDAPTATAAPAPGLDPERIIGAVREVVGQRGEVRCLSADSDAFAVTYDGTGFADHVDDRRAELVEKVAAKIGGRWRPDWDTEHDKVTLRRRPDLPAMVPHPGFAPGRPWNIIPVAPGVAFDLLNTAHLLIQGATGSGKTVLLHNIIAAFVDSASRGEAEVYIGDPKRIEMLDFQGKPGITKIATSDQDLWDLAISTRDEMDRRYSLIESREATQADFKPLLLVIDEYEEYVDRMRSFYIESGMKTSMKLPMAPALSAMASVLRMARKCHIHVVIGTQRPDADFFGGRARDNLQGRAGVGRLTPEASRMCFGRSDVGRDVPISAKGRATFQVGDEEPIEAQTYYLN